MDPRGDKYILGTVQIITTAFLGGFKVYFGRRGFGGGSGSDAQNTLENGDISELKQAQSGTAFYRDMLLVGVMRGATVLLGLISLALVPVSFTETVKSTAPLFTVIFAKVILGQQTSLQVKLSLIPVVVGLALCSATELSFNIFGFLAAVMNNVVDCIQNVYSKKLLAFTSPTELQFYTSIAAATLQLPMLAVSLWPLLTAENGSFVLDFDIWCLLLIDGVFYHLQSVTA